VHRSHPLQTLSCSDELAVGIGDAAACSGPVLVVFSPVELDLPAGHDALQAVDFALVGGDNDS
jgi:hypothetical protein